MGAEIPEWEEISRIGLGTTGQINLNIHSIMSAYCLPGPEGNLGRRLCSRVHSGSGLTQQVASPWASHPCTFLLVPQSERVRYGVTEAFWISVVLEDENVCWNFPFFNKEDTLISETRWRWYACLEKLSPGTASLLLSKFVLIKIEAAVIGHINFPNRLSLILRLGLRRSTQKPSCWHWYGCLEETAVSGQA